MKFLIGGSVFYVETWSDMCRRHFKLMDGLSLSAAALPHSQPLAKSGGSEIIPSHLSTDPVLGLSCLPLEFPGKYTISKYDMEVLSSKVETAKARVSFLINGKTSAEAVFAHPADARQYCGANWGIPTSVCDVGPLAEGGMTK